MREADWMPSSAGLTTPTRTSEAIMKNLIEALQIFAQYQDLKWPTHCEHDVLYIMGVTHEEVSAEHRQRLDALGFIWMEGDDCWGSFRYGSA